MPNFRARFNFPAILVFVVAGMSFGGSGLYAGLRLDEPPLLYLLATAWRLWVIGWWLTDDLRRRGGSWIYCPGLFLHVAWPFVIPYYLPKTRGPRSLIAMAVFVAVSIAAAVTGAVIGAALVSS